jgi:hypothetical protein
LWIERGKAAERNKAGRSEEKMAREGAKNLQCLFYSNWQNY